jgi:polyisoprenoid-binding protein YceI
MSRRSEPAVVEPRRWFRRRWVRRAALAGAVIVVLAVGAPFAFIHFVEKKAPPKLALTPTAASGAAAPAGDAASVSGTYHVTTGSLVGYRVDEILVGQKTTAVGRTSEVTGSVSVDGTAVPKATFTAQMASVVSDQSGRNAQFRGRIMDTSTYPTATFTLTHPITLEEIPAVGAVTSAQATGNLTLRGKTRPVTFTIDAERTTSGVEVQGDIPVLFSNWDIPNPSFGPIDTQDHGTMEFLLQLAQGTATASATRDAGRHRRRRGGGFAPITVPSTTVPPLSLSGGS